MQHKARPQLSEDTPGAKSSTGPLTGVTVIELASAVMVPYACQILGDLGANVIKVEPAGGDDTRGMGGGPHPQLSGIALNLYRNKRSVQLDLSTNEAIDIYHRLLKTADVMVTNLRPSALRKLGLEYETVRATHSQLIYCEAHGFSLESGEAHLPAYEDIIQAATGLPALTQTATEAINYLPTVEGNKVTGLTITYAILAALYHRATTGQAQRVEVPMFDAVLSFNLVEHLSRAAMPGGLPGYDRILSLFRRPNKTKDGYITILLYSDKSWSDLYHAVGHEYELSDPWFQQRLENPEPVFDSLSNILLERTTAEWLILAGQLGIPAGPAPSLDEIVEDRRA